MSVIMENRSGNRDEMIHIVVIDTEKGEAVGELSIGLRDLTAGIYQVGTFCMAEGYDKQGMDLRWWRLPLSAKRREMKKPLC